MSALPAGCVRRFISYLTDEAEFPLSVKSGHLRRKRSCPLYPQ
jgi:hypothetical protein